MIAVIATPLWRARGPRFLMLLLLLWVSIRVAASWPAPSTLRDTPAADQAMTQKAKPTLAAITERSHVTPTSFRSDAISYQMERRPMARPPVVAAMTTPEEAGRLPDPIASRPSSAWAGSNRHNMRFSMLDGILPKPFATHRAALQVAPAKYFPPGSLAPSPVPSWPQARSNRWSLAAYSYWRAGSGTPASLGTGPRTMLGASQTAARIDYAISGDGRLRAFARFAATPGTVQQTEAALGLTARPFAKLPIDIHIEKRVALSGGGRGRTLAYASGGIDRLSLPVGFNMSGYAQGGIAGPHSIEAFVDAAIIVQRPIYEEKAMRLSVGAMVAGAAQANARRIDVGPRAMVDLPLFGKGAQVSLDWRERVAGNARPNDGLALTLSAGF